MLSAFSNWLAATALSETIQTVSWVIPALQTIHILAVAIVFSAALLVDFRILRLFERDEPLGEVARRFLPAIWPALVVLLVTGTLLIIAEPRRALLNASFYLKMALLLVAILLTAGLQGALASASWEASWKDSWKKVRTRQIAGKALAAASILIWTGILFAGRWIAYTQAG